LSGTIKTDGYQESIINALKKGWAAGFPPDNMVYIIIIEEPILPVSHDGISFRQASSMGHDDDNQSKSAYYYLLLMLVPFQDF
jgi:hypothetical protein